MNDNLDNLQVLTTKEHASLHRKINYNSVRLLRSQGFGYKRIAKELNYNVNTVKSAVRLVDKE